MLSISWFVDMCVCLSICLSVCLFTFEVPLKHFVAPTSQSWMSKSFRDSESLGKSNEKKWSQIGKLLLIKGVKLLREKNSFWANFAFMNWIFFISMFLTPFNSLFAPTSCSLISKLFRFLEFLGKINGKKWSQIWKLLLIKGAKSPRPFFNVFYFYLFTLLKRLFAPTSQSPMTKLFRFWNPWRKVIKRNGLRFEIFCL